MAATGVAKLNNAFEKSDDCICLFQKTTVPLKMPPEIMTVPLKMYSGKCFSEIAMRQQ